MMTTKAQTASPTKISRNKSLVALDENFRSTFLEQKNKKRNALIVLEHSNINTKFISPAFVSRNNSSNNLCQQGQQVQQLQQQLVVQEQQRQQQQQSQQQESSPRARPLKKRKISMEGVAFTTGPPATGAANAVAIITTSAEEETAAVLRRKALAARLRANGVSRRLVLKPSDFARSIFVKNMTNKITGCAAPLDVLPFPDPTTIDVAIHQKYSQELYTYVRKGTDLEGFKKCLRELHKQYNGLQQHFRCCNRFGESLLHLACRRGRTDFVRFIIEEMGTNTSTAREMLTVRDDCNKTPLHDACWTPSPNFELVELILKHAPEQVLMEDVRGNTPFDYVQKEDYAVWLKFLWQRKSMLRGSSVLRQQQASN